MFPLWGLMLGLVIGFLRGGRLANLSALSLRAVWLVFTGLVLQLLIFPTPWFNPLIQTGTEYFHFASYGLIALFFIVNWRVWTLWLMALGMVLNAIVITVNGGYMPASAAALEAAGKIEAAEQLRNATGHVYANTILMSENTQLNFLGDWLYVPSWVPLANAFSLGDLVLMIGIAWLIQSAMCRPASPPADNEKQE